MQKVLIVTGASKGIGAATSKLAARDGWAVCVNYRTDSAAADTVVREILELGGRAIAIRADVTSESSVISLFDDAERSFGQITGLVNNAGILLNAACLADITLARWNAIIATNLTGSFLCAREAVRRMAKSRGRTGGAIVNVSSMAAILGSPYEFVDYAASKGAIDTLTIGLAKEVASDGIRVNGVRPGLIDTNIHAASGDVGRVNRLVSTVPMQRIGTADEVAGTIVWLLSEDASYCTGSIVNVSGGR